MTNRNPIKQMFITFPKSNVDKITFRDSLLKFKPEYYKVVEEKHKDGTPHLHAIVKWKNKYSKAHILKKFKEMYPEDYKRIDVEAIRSIKNALEYLNKEDPTPLTSGPYVDSRASNTTKLEKMKQTFAQSLGFASYQKLEEHHQSEEEFIERNERAIHNTILLNVRNNEHVPNDFKFSKIISKNQKTRNDITYLSKQLNIKLQ